MLKRFDRREMTLDMAWYNENMRILSVIGEYFISRKYDVRLPPEKRAINWWTTILVPLFVAAIILFVVLFVNPSPETTGWFGTRFGQ